MNYLGYGFTTTIMAAAASVAFAQAPAKTGQQTDRHSATQQQMQTNQQQTNQQNQKQTNQQQMQSTEHARTIDLGNLEDNPRQYIDQKVTVTGEIAHVVGPRLFTIDEANWIDLDAETLVVVPAPFAAMVRSDSPVTVTGTVRNFVEADVQREWGWVGDNPTLHVDLKNRPVIVATSVMEDGRNGLIALVTTPAKATSESAKQSSGSTANSGNAGQSSTGNTNANTTPSASSSMKNANGDNNQARITDSTQLAGATGTSMVGRQVKLDNVQVAKTTNNGFWINQNDQWLFVLEADHDNRADHHVGDTVSVQGVVLEFPKQMRRQMGENAQNESIYVQANDIA